MLEAVIAVLGVLLGVWVLVRDDHRVELLALAKRHKDWIVTGSLAALMIAVGGPFISATWIDHRPLGVDWSVWTPPMESLVLVCVVAITLWPLRNSLLPGREQKWDLKLVEAANGRIQELVRQGKASTAAAVVARFAAMADRAESDGGELDAYEEVLDWCFDHEAFVKCIVLEQSDTAARLLTARGQITRAHAHTMVYWAFIHESSSLRSTLRTRQQVLRRNGRLAGSSSVGILDTIIADSGSRDSLQLWIPVTRALIKELKRRRSAVGSPDYRFECESRELGNGGEDVVACGLTLLDLMLAVRQPNLNALGGLLSCFRALATILGGTLASYSRAKEYGLASHYNDYFQSLCSSIERALTAIERPGKTEVDGKLLLQEAGLYTGTLGYIYSVRFWKIPAELLSLDTASSDFEILIGKLRESDRETDAQRIVDAFAGHIRGSRRSIARNSLQEMASEDGPSSNAHWLMNAVCAKWNGNQQQ